MEVIVLVWVLVMATLWLVRMLAEEAWAAVRGQTSPRIERRRAREKLAADCGKPTIGQALAFRVADRIAHPPRRQWAVKLRGLLDEMWDDALAEARVRHQHAHEARLRAAETRRKGRPRPPRGNGWQARTGADAPTGEPRSGKSGPLVLEQCGRCGYAYVAAPATICDGCSHITGTAPPQPDGPWVAASRRDDTPPWDACDRCGNAMLAGRRLDVSYDEGDGGAMVDTWCPTCNIHSYYGWPLSDAEFEAEFGYPFGERPDEDEDEPGDEPQPQPAKTPEPPVSPDERTPTMPAATFTINGDVRDPRTSLNAAEMMRGANNAIADEMDVLLNNMRNADLGQGMLDAIASLADEQRSYADSNAEQCRVYAAQVLAQQNIYDDEDLRNTVRDTYLDMEGGDLVTPPAAVPGSVAISATDCNTPEAGSWFCDQVARAYDGMKVSIDQMKGNHEQQNVPAESVEFLGHQLGFATSIATHAAALRDRFGAHVAKLADTLDPNDLRRTQNGYARAGA
jgi:hypothetical protein